MNADIIFGIVYFAISLYGYSHWKKAEGKIYILITLIYFVSFLVSVLDYVANAFHLALLIRQISYYLEITILPLVIISSLVIMFKKR